MPCFKTFREIHPFYNDIWRIDLSHYLCILSQPREPREEDFRTIAQRHRVKKEIERTKGKIGKVKQLKSYVTEEVKTVKNKCCAFGHEMWDS